MADHADWAEGRKHYTYKGHLGRALHPCNTGRMQWGPEYRNVHRLAWLEAFRVLSPGGLLIVNVSDHIRAGAVIPVCDWHRMTLIETGLRHVETVDVPTRRQRHGANGTARVEAERVMVFRKPGVGISPTVSRTHHVFPDGLPGFRKADGFDYGQAAP